MRAAGTSQTPVALGAVGLPLGVNLRPCAGAPRSPLCGWACSGAWEKALGRSQHPSTVVGPPASAFLASPGGCGVISTSAPEGPLAELSHLGKQPGMAVICEDQPWQSIAGRPCALRLRMICGDSSDSLTSAPSGVSRRFWSFYFIFKSPDCPLP